MKISTAFLTALFFLSTLFVHSAANAGFLDKINEATEKMNKMSHNQQNQQAQGGGGLGATKLDYLDKANACMDPLKGYRAKLTADRIEWKLMNEQGISPQQRQFLQQDLVAARTAQNQGTDNIVSDPANPQRYLQDISSNDQVEINRQFGVFYQEIMNKCNGADHMGIGKRTEMNYVQDNSAAMNSSAAQQQSMTDIQACLGQVRGVRWRVVAQKLESKMQAIPNLSAQDRQAWEADIAAVREADTKALMMPVSPDPSQPMRYMMRLTQEEQMAVNQEYAVQSQAMTAQCSAQANSGVTARAPSTGGLVDHSQSPANPNARRMNPTTPASQPWNGSSGGGSLSSALGATNLDYLDKTSSCDNPIKGNFARLTADKLQGKLNTASGLTPGKRKELEADIAAWRTAQSAGADIAVPPDPSNPYRYYDHLTRDERAEINQQHAAFANKITAGCANADHMGVGAR